MCDNTVSYWVPKGYDYREVEVRCGLTDPHGGRAVCDECAADVNKMREVERDECSIKADNEIARMSGWGEY
jgi:hypothetical protein|tara:strand:+ start:493 stop:705 length:213 start_codon:yes stop_codon:yes gene_type:complete